MRTGVIRLLTGILLGIAAVALCACEEPRPEVTVDAGDPGPQGSASAIYATPAPQISDPSTTAP